MGAGIVDPLSVVEAGDGGPDEDLLAVGADETGLGQGGEVDGAE